MTTNLQTALARAQGEKTDCETAAELGINKTVVYTIRTGRRAWSPKLARMLGVKKPPKDGRYQYRRAWTGSKEEAQELDSELQKAGHSSLTPMVDRWIGNQQLVSFGVERMEGIEI